MSPQSDRYIPKRGAPSYRAKYGEVMNMNVKLSKQITKLENEVKDKESTINQIFREECIMITKMEVCRDENATLGKYCIWLAFISIISIALTITNLWVAQ